MADITIAGEDLGELVLLRRLADALMAHIRFNYRFVIGFNSALIVLGALGVCPPLSPPPCTICPLWGSACGA